MFNALGVNIGRSTYNTINKIAFYEYKPDNKNYKFMILKPFSERQLVKIERLMSND